MAVISLSRIVKFWADQKPDDVAIYHEGITITWAELEARSNRLARAYAELGVGFDDNPKYSYLTRMQRSEAGRWIGRRNASLSSHLKEGGEYVFELHLTATSASLKLYAKEEKLLGSKEWDISLPEKYKLGIRVHYGSVRISGIEVEAKSKR